MNADEQQVWQAMQSVYQGFLAHDPSAVDALLDDDVTIWDSAEPRMARGLSELRRLRAARPPADAGPQVVDIEANDPVISVWGDTALVRHLLTVRFDDATVQLVRNTSVWRRTDGRWLAVHNHEDVLVG